MTPQHIPKARPRRSSVDLEHSRVNGKTLVAIIAATAAAVLCYARFEQRTSALEAQQAQLTHSIDKLTEQIGKVFVDGVLTRQMQSWIDLARVLNKDKSPGTVFPDLPR